ncbi:hypothetical protein DW085_06110 [Clostridium sp. AF50-3]|uniref:hypothetical protein n=1 Tax=Clostridium sp. AF50-3 TaxID=2293021 RepID=UPI000E4BCD80|nr:hypothetical protein [Clostridium sp. AF50-3]RHO67964.1 hypothetical protein DW085_06110 [Clostridium sp. AF50-3]
MIEHIEITGEGGIIRLKWEWDDLEIETLDIYYRKKEYEKTAVFQTGILHEPQKKFGYVEKKMSSERGLYSFLVIAHFQSGDVAEKWIHDVPLGGKIRVLWSLKREKHGYRITFPQCDAQIPANIVIAKCNRVKMKLGYPISRETELMVLENLNEQSFELMVENPYCKIIELKQC